MCLICSLIVTKPISSGLRIRHGKSVRCSVSLSQGLPLLPTENSEGSFAFYRQGPVLVCLCLSLFQFLLLVRYRVEECGTRKENFVVELEAGLGLFLKSWISFWWTCQRCSGSSAQSHKGRCAVCAVTRVLGCVCGGQWLSLAGPQLLCPAGHL